MITAALRSLWDEPRAADPPGRTWRDLAFVGAVMASALLEGTLRADVAWRPVVTIVTVALAPVLLWRRSHPLGSVVVGLGVGTALGLAGQVAGVPGLGLSTMSFVLVLVYALVRWGSGPHIVVGTAVVGIAAAFALATDDTEPAELFGGFGVLAAAAAGGAALRYRAEIWRRAIEQTRNTERVGLSRELHDTVAHHVSAITVQAQAGRAMAATRPDAALEALEAIESEATRTLAEMRSMVRVLRDGAPADYAPAPGVSDLVSLARRHPDPVVEVEVTGAVTGLPPQVDAAVYRLAQESLTNALRHARNASRVQISVVRDAERLRLRVIDDGQSERPRPATVGFGLQGMTERAHLLGGTLRAGPTPVGGWAVDAELPTEPPR